jgi:cell division protein FtsB
VICFYTCQNGIHTRTHTKVKVDILQKELKAKASEVAALKRSTEALKKENEKSNKEKEALNFQLVALRNEKKEGSDKN